MTESVRSRERIDRPRIEAAVREILLAVGEDPDREGLQETPARLVPSHSPQFVEVAPVWRTPATEVEIHRPDGARLRITYSELSPTLVPLLQTFLESR